MIYNVQYRVLSLFWKWRKMLLFTPHDAAFRQTKKDTIGFPSTTTAHSANWLYVFFVPFLGFFGFLDLGPQFTRIAPPFLGSLTLACCARLPGGAIEWKERSSWAALCNGFHFTSNCIAASQILQANTRWNSYLFERKIEKKGHGKKLKNENLDKWT